MCIRLLLNEDASGCFECVGWFLFLVFFVEGVSFPLAGGLCSFCFFIFSFFS